METADLQQKIKDAELYCDDHDEASWEYQTGVLLSINEAKSLLTEIKRLEKWNEDKRVEVNAEQVSLAVAEAEREWSEKQQNLWGAFQELLKLLPKATLAELDKIIKEKLQKV